MPIGRWHIDRAVAIAKRWGATRIVLFGSAVDSLAEARDLDLACAGVPGWEFFGMAGEIMMALPVAVDVVFLEDDPAFARHVEKWGRALYAA